MLGGHDEKKKMLDANNKKLEDLNARIAQRKKEREQKRTTTTTTTTYSMHASRTDINDSTADTLFGGPIPRNPHTATDVGVGVSGQRMPRQGAVSNEYNNHTTLNAAVTEPSSNGNNGNNGNNGGGNNTSIISTTSNSSNHSHVNRGRNPFASPEKPLDSSKHTNAMFLHHPDISSTSPTTGGPGAGSAGGVGLPPQVGSPNIFDSSPRDRSTRYGTHPGAGTNNTVMATRPNNMSALSHSITVSGDSAGGLGTVSAHPLIDEDNKQTFHRPPPLNVHKQFLPPGPGTRVYQQPPNAPLSPSHAQSRATRAGGGAFGFSDAGKEGKEDGDNEKDIFTSDHQLNSEIIAQSGPDHSYLADPGAYPVQGAYPDAGGIEEDNSNAITSNMGHRHDAPLGLNTSGGASTVASFSPKKLHDATMNTTTTTYTHGGVEASRGSEGQSSPEQQHFRQQEERITDLKATIEKFKKSHEQDQSLVKQAREECTRLIDSKNVLSSDLESLRQELRTLQLSTSESHTLHSTLTQDNQNLKALLQEREREMVEYRSGMERMEEEKTQAEVALGKLQEVVEGINDARHEMLEKERQEHAADFSDLEKELDFNKKQVQTKSGEISRLQAELSAAKLETQSILIENGQLVTANDELYADNEKFSNEVHDLMQQNIEIETQLSTLQANTSKNGGDGGSTSYVSPESTEAHLLALDEKLRQAKEENKHLYERDITILQNELQEQKSQNSNYKQLLTEAEERQESNRKLTEEYMAENERLRDSANNALTAQASSDTSIPIASFQQQQSLLQEGNTQLSILTEQLTTAQKDNHTLVQELQTLQSAYQRVLEEKAQNDGRVKHVIDQETDRSLETEALRAKYSQLLEEFDAYKAHMAALEASHGTPSFSHGTPGSGEKGSHSAPSSPRTSGHVGQVGGAFSGGVTFFSTQSGTPLRHADPGQGLPVTVDEEGGTLSSDPGQGLRSVEGGGGLEGERVRLELERELGQYKNMYDEQMGHIDTLSNQKAELENYILKLTTEIDTLKEEGAYSLSQELSQLKADNEKLKQLALSSSNTANDTLSPVPESAVSIRRDESVEAFDHIDRLKNEIDECNQTISDLQRQLSIQRSDNITVFLGKVMEYLCSVRPVFMSLLEVYVRAIYEVYNPSKLNEIATVVHMIEGFDSREQEMIEQLYKKYGIVGADGLTPRQAPRLLLTGHLVGAYPQHHDREMEMDNHAFADIGTYSIEGEADRRFALKMESKYKETRVRGLWSGVGYKVLLWVLLLMVGWMVLKLLDRQQHLCTLDEYRILT